MDYKCKNQWHSVPKYFLWVKCPARRTPLACSNNRYLSIVCISYWRAESLIHLPKYTLIHLSKWCTYSLSKEIHPKCLNSRYRVFSLQASINSRTVTFDVKPIDIFPVNWKSNDGNRQQSKIQIFKNKSCLLLIFCFAVRKGMWLYLVWLGKHSGVCEAQGLWIAILPLFYSWAHMVKSWPLESQWQKKKKNLTGYQELYLTLNFKAVVMWLF